MRSDRGLSSPYPSRPSRWATTEWNTPFSTARLTANGTTAGGRPTTATVLTRATRRSVLVVWAECGSDRAATASGLDWLFIGPQATLFDDDVEQSLTHFFSKNPDKENAIQATWQHSRDSSAVWATRHAGSLDPLFVAPNAIEWLLLDVSGAQFGPRGGDKLARTAFIQRVNTIGGVKPPSAECTAATLNAKRFVSYEADYFFYR